MELPKACTVFGDRIEGSTWLVKQQQPYGRVWSNDVHESARTTSRVVFMAPGNSGFTDLHSDSLKLSATESLWWLCSCQFTERAANGTIWIVMLNTNNVMHRIRAGKIGIPAFRQTFNHGVRTSETCRLVNKLKVSGMFRITERDVVLNLGGSLFKDIV
jgi:hypothetical protein